jgi:hypothetical protein
MVNINPIPNHPQFDMVPENWVSLLGGPYRYPWFCKKMQGRGTEEEKKRKGKRKRETEKKIIGKSKRKGNKEEWKRKRRGREEEMEKKGKE